MKRDPSANPIGPEPERDSQEAEEIQPDTSSPSPAPIQEQGELEETNLIKREGTIEPRLQERALLALRPRR